jgi:dethiobiotin synthetase
MAPAARTTRPGRVVAVVGTGTDVGKTWVGAHLLTGLRAGGCSVAARKPVQSFDPADDPASRDAAVLGSASGETPETVCHPERWYEVALAPPMAAEELGRPSFAIGDLIAELHWPEPIQSGRPVDVGLVETAGGVRSPLAADGDCLDLCTALAPDLVLLVADAGLGTINVVRLTADALAALDVPVAVVLNRFDPAVVVHARNLHWLRAFDRMEVVVIPGDEGALVELVRAPLHKAPLDKAVDAST